MVSPQTIEPELTGNQLPEDQGFVEAELHRLAREHKRIKQASGKPLPLLKDSETYSSFLREAQQYFIANSRDKLSISLAGEWLLDNFYVVQQSFNQVLEDIQPGTYRDLPKLIGTALAGYPRVYAIARYLLDTASEPVTSSYIENFVETYQQETPLTIGELWALPAMLNLVSLENLAMTVCQLAELKRQPEVPNGVESDGVPPDESVVSTSVINLRQFSTQDWKVYFEAVSHVERILRQDPAGVYGEMDFETRNLYRTEIESLAPSTGEVQKVVARAVVELAQSGDGERRFRHIGYYLIDAGRARLERDLEFKPSLQLRINRWLQAHNFSVYVTGIMVIMAVILLLVATYAINNGASLILLGSTLILALLPATLVAVQVVNWVISRSVSPGLLPKMDYQGGIPSDRKTIIVIPALLTDEEEADSLVQQIELHYLRNSDPNLLFALLLDYADAQQKQMPDDEKLHDYLAKCIHELNSKYQLQESPRFLYFLRERKWNLSEDIWMGWERKRGKLHEFNQMITNPMSETSYVSSNAAQRDLGQIRYIITLDADTILPKNSARRLVATMSHPLNQPVFNERTHAVERGYAILQPRVEIMPTSANQSWFTRVFAGDTSLDLYTRAVSDTYQDWFGEGTYVGKGIYDVRAFEHSLAGRIPDNRLLSHDLFESLHARTGLVTDITLLEDYPPHYLVHMQRLHRWIRGDWQLLPWLLPRVPSANGKSVPNYLSPLDIWKIADNLRRSLMGPALLLFLIAGWTILPGSSWIWTLIFLLGSGFPFIISPVNHLLGAQKLTDWRVLGDDIRLEFERWMLFLVFLPYEAYVSLDAVITTLFRLQRRRNLLQWISAAHAVRLFGANPSSQLVIRQMRSSLTLVALITLAIIFTEPVNLIVAMPFLLAWALSPYIAYMISQPMTHKVSLLTEEQKDRLRLLARRTWLFFEYYVGPEDNWLPPDHFQQTPRTITAHHTSPTNIGLFLLCTLTAYDMGYVGLPEIATRLQLAFDSLDKVEKHRGHLLNWYDTRTLLPLEPRYVSMVDSGNFVGSLIALKQGLNALAHNRPLDSQRWRGLVDTLDLLGDALHRTSTTATDDIDQFFLGVRQQVNTVSGSLSEQILLQAHLTDDVLPELTTMLMTLVDSGVLPDTSGLTEIRLASARIRQHLENMRRDTQLLLPWATLIANPPHSLVDRASTDHRTNQLWQELGAALDESPSLSSASDIYREAQQHTGQLRKLVGADSPEVAQWCEELDEALTSARLATQVLSNSFSQLQSQIEIYLQDTDFQFLFNENRKIFHIGYHVTNEQLDNSFYDLLASEARIGSLAAIALDQIPPEHWLHLGRAVTLLGGKQALLSWSGTMFEYLMPLLFMRNYPNTLLEQTYETVVDHQIGYGNQHDVPWGISESGYYAFDAHMNYQYHAFGVPDLALKHSLDRELVVAPYASLLALPVKPQAVMENLAHLERIGALQPYGLIEAIDYTPGRLPLGQSMAHVEEFMAHHQAMILLSVTNHLYNNIVVERFHADPRIQSVELLLQEQIPRNRTTSSEPADGELSRPEPASVSAAPWDVPARPFTPRVHYLSNGEFGTLITSAGSGYSQWKSNALTRWRADTTLEDWGSWLYLCDKETDEVWSIGYQPAPAGGYKVVFSPHKATFECRHQDIFAQMELVVSPDDNVELKRIRLTNHSDRSRQLLISSYGEIVMAPQNADKRHPAFNKMFIESEYIDEVDALFFHRRPRSSHESTFYLGHLLTRREPRSEHLIFYETDRRQFIGRNGTIHRPIAFEDTRTGFTGTTGMTLDPIMAVGHEVSIEPYATVELAYVTLASQTREDALKLAHAYQSWTKIGLAFDQAKIHGERELQRLEMSTDELEDVQRLLSALLFPQFVSRAEPAVLAQNIKSQSGLWAYGISGDYPILLVNIRDEDDLPLVQQMIQAHKYWRDRQIQTTLVILNRRDTDYSQTLYHQVHRLINKMESEIWLNRHDGIFILHSEKISDSDLTLLSASARVFLDADEGTLDEQLAKLEQKVDVYLPAFTVPTPSPENEHETMPELARPANLLFDNGFGGFAPDVMEYVIYRQPQQATPAPWINVIANEHVGFTVSEVGGGFSWAINSGENRLTAWRNDPVIDMPSEIVYLRDEENGAIWTPTPMPAGTNKPYLIRHGAGYSTFEHHSHALKQTVTLFVAPDDPVKFIKLRLENTSKRTRRITATYYGEWVLGPVRDITQQYLIPTFDQDAHALLVRNPYNLDFGNCYMFVSASREFHGLTTDRTEFLGRMGRYDEPMALTRIGLGGTVEAGRDTCAAVQLHVDLPPGAAEEVFFIIGGGVERREALDLVHQYRHPQQIEAAWQQSQAKWESILNTIEVRTPSESMNTILPWLLYQALSCRIWGRSALYQSSGAFGFRDQLQDVMSIVHARPDVARKHILRAAAHQFEAGDVLHWWHPPSGRGVRTRFSDDLLWLPYVTAQYVLSTGDTSILREEVPFKIGAPLQPDEEERYGYYESTEQAYPLYEHCLRALDRGFTEGRHGLPLMGAGDWNDGMNRVGIEGDGESVWVGWFLFETVRNFVNICALMGEDQKAAHYLKRIEDLQVALEQHAWDGAWYRRAYYDDGTPLGSHFNEECRIDSIAQSWGVISDAASSERAKQAMQSLREMLIKPEDRLLLLFTPPFDDTPKDPGYIKGYPPGVRENGGQYTHAAIWTVWAFAQMGEGDYAHELFSILNPILHAENHAAAELYRVEPYVVAADVYSAHAYRGRGGWTWYTGSSGWFYRLGIEALLGIRREGAKLYVDPCIPREWSGFQFTYRYGQATYHIQVENPNGTQQGIQKIVVDGSEQSTTSIELADEKAEHHVVVTLV